MYTSQRTNESKQYLGPKPHGVLAERGLCPLSVAVVEVLQLRCRRYPVNLFASKGKADLANDGGKSGARLGVPSLRQISENACE